MKDPRTIVLRALTLSCVLALLAGKGLSQGYDDPLRIQGIDHTTLQSSASRAAGGITIGLQNDVSMMFVNPASLQSLAGIQIAFGGREDFSRMEQLQQYAPLKYYSNFSLLMERLTDGIGDPDTSHHGTNAGDTVQRPYDDLGPNWSHTAHKAAPVQAMIGVPFTIGEYRFVAGAGAVEYANLNHYYQNNNVLYPAIGSERPIPTPLPSTDSLSVQWYQYLRQREGFIKGYGLALSGSPSKELTFGLSALVLDGSTDDYEQHTGRGTLIFFANWFRLDSVYSHVKRVGTSDYKGQEYTFSGIFRGRNISVGFSVKPPMTITRSFTATIVTDTTGAPFSAVVSGEDKIKLPWRGTVGLSLQLRENLILGLEYEIRSFASAVYTSESGTESNPWLSASILHFGAQYTANDWLLFRGGMRKQAEVFETEGNPLIGDPVSYTIYSAGCGLVFSGVHVNLSYEYGLMKYDDVWQTNVNLNNDSRHALSATVVYDIPWAW